MITNIASLVQIISFTADFFEFYLNSIARMAKLWTLKSDEIYMKKKYTYLKIKFIKIKGIFSINSKHTFPCKTINWVRNRCPRRTNKIFDQSDICCPLRKCSGLLVGSLIDRVSVVYVIGLPMRSVFNNGRNGDLSHWWFLHHNSNLTKISSRSQPYSNKVITTTFCTWHDFCIIVAHATISLFDMIDRNRITGKWNFPQSYIATEKLLV